MVPPFRNPLAGRDLTALGRGWELAAILVANLCVLGLTGIVMVAGEPQVVAQGASGLGPDVFRALAVMQLVIVMLLAPLAGIAVVASERRRMTWDLLIMTRIPSLDIVWGKLVAAVAPGLLLLAASLPLFSLTALFGGVDAWHVAATIAVLGATFVLLSAIGLAAALVATRPLVAATLAMSAVLALTAGLTVLIVSMGNSSRISIGPVVATPQVARLAPLDPLAALVSSEPGGNSAWLVGSLATINHPLGLPLSLVVSYGLIALGISAIIVFLAAGLVRPRHRSRTLDPLLEQGG